MECNSALVSNGMQFSFSRISNEMQFSVSNYIKCINFLLVGLNALAINKLICGNS